MDYDKVMIVAHPDDETVFGSTELLGEKGWLVVCVTNGNNRRRRKEFSKVMDKVGAQFEIWDYEDRWEGDFDRQRLKSDLEEVLARGAFRKVVSHNRAGEYGHTQHKALSEVVFKLVREHLYVFGTSFRKLEEPMLMKKQELLDCYRSQDLEWLRHYIEHECVRRVR